MTKKVKTGGRKAGTPNKNKQELLDRVHSKYPNYCPIEAMCEIAVDIENDVALRLQASKEVAQYIYPKRKAIEMSGEGGKELVINMVNYGDKKDV